MSLVVIGTDTDVGKTVVSSLLLSRYADRLNIAYWKPIATGFREGRDSDTVRALVPEKVEILEECYLFKEPVSPHLASQQENTRIRPGQVMDILADHLLKTSRSLVVEGIGGLLVPLTASGLLLADLLAETRLPCLLVASTRVGTINHTLLTLEAAQRRKIPVAGVILNGDSNPDNAQAIRTFGQVPILGEIPTISNLSRESVQRHSRLIEPEGSVLLELLSREEG